MRPVAPPARTRRHPRIANGPGTVPPGEKHVVVLYGANLAGDAQRASMRSVIEAMKQSHGVVYEEMIDRNTRAPMLMNKDLVIIGGHANFCEADQDMAFGDLPVPVIVSKDCDRTTRIFRLGTMHNTPNDQTSIRISNPMHPLAAGLMGDVAVFPSNSRIVNATDLGPKAVVIATTPAFKYPCIFYYDKGDADAGRLRRPRQAHGLLLAPPHRRHRRGEEAADGGD